MRHDFELLRSFTEPALLVKACVHVRGGMECFMPKPAVTIIHTDRTRIGRTHSDRGLTGQQLAGKGELVFEGEVLEMPTWGGR